MRVSGIFLFVRASFNLYKLFDQTKRPCGKFRFGEYVLGTKKFFWTNNASLNVKPAVL